MLYIHIYIHIYIYIAYIHYSNFIGIYIYSQMYQNKHKHGSILKIYKTRLQDRQIIY